MIGSLAPNPHLVVRDTGTPRGRGVFATRDYAAGEVVEASPIVEVQGEWDGLPACLQYLVYDWSYLRGREAGTTHALVLGLGSLINHSDHPNLGYAADPGLRALVFTARRDIACGEEITSNYNDDIPAGTGKDWFDAVGLLRAG